MPSDKTTNEKTPLLRNPDDRYNAINSTDEVLSHLAQEFNEKLLEISHKRYNTDTKHNMMEEYAKKELPLAIKEKDEDALGVLLNAGKGLNLDEEFISVGNGNKKITPMQAELLKRKPSAENVEFLLQNGASAKTEHIAEVLNKRLTEEGALSLLEPLLNKGAKSNADTVHRAIYSSSDKVAAKLVEALPDNRSEYMDETIVSSIEGDLLATTKALMKKKILDPDKMLSVERPYETPDGNWWSGMTHVAPSEFARSDAMNELLRSKWQQKLLGQKQEQKEFAGPSKDS